MSYSVVVLLLMAVGGADSQEPAGARTANPSPREIADKAIKAHGGAEKLGRFKATMTMVHGKLHGHSGTAMFTGQNADEGADRQWYDYNTEFPGGRKMRLVGAVDGKHAWSTIDGAVEHDSKEELEEEREGMHEEYIATLRPLLDRSVALAPAGELQIDGKPAVGIVVSVKGHRPVKLYFDKISWLLAKSECRPKDLRTDRVYVREILYSKHQPVNGVQCAHQTKTKRDGKLFSEYELSDVKLLEKLDDDLFVEPGSKRP